MAELEQASSIIKQPLVKAVASAKFLNNINSAPESNISKYSVYKTLELSNKAFSEAQTILDVCLLKENFPVDSLKEASEKLIYSIENNRSNADAYVTLAYIHYILANNTNALNYIKQAQQTNPDIKGVIKLIKLINKEEVEAKEGKQNYVDEIAPTRVKLSEPVRNNNNLRNAYRVSAIEIDMAGLTRVSNKPQAKSYSYNEPKVKSSASGYVFIHSAEEMRNCILDSINHSRSYKQSFFNERALKIIQPKSNINKNDILLFKKVKDDAKEVVINDVNLEIINLLTTDLGKLSVDLDRTLNKDNVYKKSFLVGKTFIDNLEQKSEMELEIYLKSREDLHELISPIILEKKSKYTTPNSPVNKYNDLILKYDEEEKLFEDLTNLRKNYLLEKDLNLKNKLEKDFIKKLITFDHKFKDQVFDTIPSELVEIRKPMKKPRIFDFLPASKQKLVDKVIDGIKSHTISNKVLSKITSLNDTDQQAILNTIFADLSSSKFIEIPQSVNFYGEIYRLEKILGGSKESISFLMSSSNNDKIAVKVPILDSVNLAQSILESNTLFSKEIRIQKLASIKNNNNILELKGVIKNEQLILIVTEFAKYGTVRNIVSKIQNHNNITDEQKRLVILFILKSALVGLQFLHTERNITHYCVNPNNFFVTDNGFIKLADFGSARFGYTYNIENNTNYYTAPELLRDSIYQVSRKLDIYCFGMMIYEVLSGNSFYDYKVDETTSEGLLISILTNENPENRPILTSILRHSLFYNQIMNTSELRNIVGSLIKAISFGDEEDLVMATSDLDELSLLV